MALWIGFGAPALAHQRTVSNETIRSSVNLALAKLVNGASVHAEKKTCFACHNQTYPMLAFTESVKKRGSVPKELIAEQAGHVAEFLGDNIDNFKSGKGTGGQVDTAGAALLTLELAGYKADEITEAVASYLLKYEPYQGHWRSTSNRPPTEASHYTATYLTIRALNHWPVKDKDAYTKARIETARNWLIKASPVDHEDRVFRLLGLHQAKAEPKDLRSTAFELITKQRTDGGWAQNDSMESDPYATATALFALNETGLMSTDHPAYQAGIRFLISTQRTDGTWHVRSRSKPFQPYYESGFPHGKNQFIAITATGWATAVLARSLPEK